MRLLEIKPGYSPETSLIFKQEGHQNISRQCSDLIFQIVEEPHLEFTRKGKDLFKTVFINLADALNSCSVQIQTLDNRLLRVPMD